MNARTHLNSSTRLEHELGGAMNRDSLRRSHFSVGGEAQTIVPCLKILLLAPPSAESSVSAGVRVLPQGYWYTVLYSSVVLLLCLLVCLVGAHIYSRTAFVILLVITVTLISIFVSSLAVKPLSFIITHRLSANQSVHYNASYTGYNATTLRNNLGRKRRSF